MSNGNKDKRQLHTLVYDIIDQSTMINQEMHRLSENIDIFGSIPNSLQSMLGKIYRYEGKTQAEIASIYHIDIKNTIKYVNELYKRGYVKKVKVDNKRKEIYLTEEGHKVNEHFMEQRGIVLDKILERLPSKSLKDTGEILQLINQSIKIYNEQCLNDIKQYQEKN